MSLVKKTNEIDKIAAAAAIVNLVHQKLKEAIKPGVSLIELDEIAEKTIIENGGKPAFKGYQKFPASICSSVNDVIVHGIPNDYQLENGDVISVDVGVKKDGYYGDAAFTVCVGKSSSRAELLIKTTRDALNKSLDLVKPGVSLDTIGNFIETYVKNEGFNIAKNYGGHGIGKKLHEEPFVPNFNINQNFILKENMVICIEPMVIDGEDKLYVDPLDKWTVRTTHGGLTAHEEHTVLVTKNGGKILNK